MIIVVNGNGDTKTIIPEEINQSSNNANTIFLLAPFSKNVQVNISFLVNEVVLPSYLMEQSESISDTLNTWKIELGSPITQYYGIVKYSFRATNTQGVVIATGRGQFKVNQGVDFQLPEQPDSQTYELILQKLSDIDADILNGWTQSMGIYPYNAKFEYNLGTIVFSEDRFYKSLVDNNLGNNLTDETKWQRTGITNQAEVSQWIAGSVNYHNNSEEAHPYLLNKVNGIIDGTIPMNGTINNAVNVSEKINNVPISEIFEADGKTSKKATSDGDGNNIKETYQTKSNLVTQWQATSDNNHYPSELLVKNYVDNKISSVYRYRGSVATYDDLPTENLTVGDVYNVESDGANYAWDGEKWDMLGATIDLSLFEEKANKVTSISSASTDTEYPSAKSVYSFVKDNSPDLQNSSFKSFNIELMDAWVPNANSAIGIGLGLNSDNDSEDKSNLLVTENFVRINSEDSQSNHDSMLDVQPKNINIYANDRSSGATTGQVSAFFGYSNSDNKAGISFAINDRSNPVWFELKDGTAYLKDKEIAIKDDISSLESQIGDISTILSSVVTVSEV